jgi:hypothetical protein
MTGVVSGGVAWTAGGVESVLMTLASVIAGLGGAGVCGAGLAMGALDVTRCKRFCSAYGVGFAMKKPPENPMERAAITDPTPARYEVVLKDIAALLHELLREQTGKNGNRSSDLKLGQVARQFQHVTQLMLSWRLFGRWPSSIDREHVAVESIGDCGMCICNEFP